MKQVRNLLGLTLLVAVAVRLLAFLIAPAIPLLAALFVVVTLVVWWRGRSGHLS